MDNIAGVRLLRYYDNGDRIDVVSDDIKIEYKRLNIYKEYKRDTYFSWIQILRVLYVYVV